MTAIGALPLDTLAVVDLGAGLPGVIARRLLTDAGATAVAVDGPPEDVPAWQRGSTHLDPSRSADGRHLAALLETADIVLFGAYLPPVLRGDEEPAVAATLRFAADLRERRPAVITAIVTGYGTRGPLREHPTDPDVLVMAYAGLASMQPGGKPGPSVFQVPVLSTNAGLLLAIGVLAAVVRRARVGTGAHVETSLLSGALATMTESLVRGDGIDISGRQAQLSSRPSGVLPFTAAYECSDGRWIHLGGSYPHFVVRAAQALGLDREAPELIDGAGFDGGRLPSAATRDALFSVIAGVVRRRPSSEWEVILTDADVPFGLVKSPAEYLDDPQAAVNGLIEFFDTRGRRIEQVGPALRFASPSFADPSLVASATSIDDVRRPLAGIRVLEVGNLISAPLAARILADLGADVVKLENIDGGDLTRKNGVPAFFSLNAGKRAIAVNLKDPDGLRIARAICREYDIALANMRPGAMERLGLGADALLTLNPRLVIVNVSAFGASGPYVQRAGVDVLASATAGLQVVQGESDGRPVQMRAATTDHATGLLAAAGSLMALIGTDVTGAGSSVETCLLDASALLNANRLVRVDGRLQPRPSHATQFGPHELERLYETRDGWIAVAVDEQRWPDLASAILDGLPPTHPFATWYAAHAERREPAEDWPGEGSEELLEDAFREAPTDEWARRLRAVGFRGVPVRHEPWRSFVDDPQLAATGQVATLQLRSGQSIQLTQNWLRLDDRPLPADGATSAQRDDAAGRSGGGIPRPTPALGEDTRDVLRDLGYADATIDHLVDAGTVLDSHVPSLAH